MNELVDMSTFACFKPELGCSDEKHGFVLFSIDSWAESPESFSFESSNFVSSVEIRGTAHCSKFGFSVIGVS